MAVFEVHTSAYKWLKNRTKAELIDIICRNIDKVGLFDGNYRLVGDEEKTSAALQAEIVELQATLAEKEKALAEAMAKYIPEKEQELDSLRSRLEAAERERYEAVRIKNAAYLAVGDAITARDAALEQVKRLREALEQNDCCCTMEFTCGRCCAIDAARQEAGDAPEKGGGE